MTVTIAPLRRPRRREPGTGVAQLLREWEGYGLLEGPVDNLVRALGAHLTAALSENKTPATLKMYRDRHKQFLTFLSEQGHPPPFSLDLLNATNVRNASIWLRERSKGHRGGESAARMLVSVLKTSSAWLCDESYIDADLVARVKRPRVGTPARTPFSQSEVRDLVNAALETRWANRDMAMIYLMLDTGMRVGGLVSILVDDVNLKEHRLELRLKGGRHHTLYFGTSERRDGGRTTRTLKRWIEERQEFIERWPARHRGYLFLAFDGWPLQTAGVRKVLDRLSATSGTSHVYPHRFRHTFATWYLVRHPGDETGLRGILGHLSDDMFRTYTHVAHEIVAARAGRVSLSEAWMAEEATV